MSDDTLISTTSGLLFDPVEVTEIFRAISGVRNIRATQDYTGNDSVEADYCYQDVRGSIGLVGGYRSVVVHGSDDGALAFAVEFAVRYIKVKGVQLQLFNTQYDFHQVLSADIDLPTLKRRIDEGPFAGAPKQ